MATEIQYEIFKTAFDFEFVRYSQLNTRAKVLLSLETFVLATLILKIDSLLTVIARNPLPIVLFLMTALLLFASLVTTALSLKIESFEGIFNPMDVITNFGDEPPSNAEFLDDRIAEIAVATEYNSEMNDRRANRVRLASVFLLCGLASTFFFLAFSMLNTNFGVPARS